MDTAPKVKGSPHLFPTQRERRVCPVRVEMDLLLGPSLEYPTLPQPSNVYHVPDPVYLFVFTCIVQHGLSLQTRWSPETSALLQSALTSKPPAPHKGHSATLLPYQVHLKTLLLVASGSFCVLLGKHISRCNPHLLHERSQGCSPWCSISTSNRLSRWNSASSSSSPATRRLSFKGCKVMPENSNNLSPFRRQVLCYVRHRQKIPTCQAGSKLL